MNSWDNGLHQSFVIGEKEVAASGSCCGQLNCIGWPDRLVEPNPGEGFRGVFKEWKD